MKLITNEDILKIKKVVLINENGENKGITSTTFAMELAAENDLDLVCVSDKQEIPVCKIMDYNRAKFEQNKKAKINKKKNNIGGTSEIQISYTTMKHDLETKVQTCRRLLESKKASLVRIVLRLRGREINLLESAKEKILMFAEMCSDFASLKNGVIVENRDVKILLEKNK